MNSTIDIFNADGTILVSPFLDRTNDSYRYRQVMGENAVYLKFSLAEFVEIPVGSYIIFRNEKYTLFRPENLTKAGTRIFQEPGVAMWSEVI